MQNGPTTTSISTTNIRRTAILVGLLFLTATVSFLVAEALINGVLDRPDYLSGASADANALTVGALLSFVNGLAVVGIAVLMYPLLKGYSESLALGYIGFRVGEFVACLFALATPLLVIALGDRVRDGTIDAAASQQLGSLLQAEHNVAIVMVYLIVSVDGGILAYLLYQTRLIPRWLAVLGVIAYPVLFVGTVLDMFDVVDVTQGAGMLAVIPGGLFELILPIWLLTKGFTTKGFTSTSGHQAVDREDVLVGVGRP
jgi:Domain of unknown function (DUF4386)